MIVSSLRRLIILSKSAKVDTQVVHLMISCVTKRIISGVVQMFTDVLVPIVSLFLSATMLLFILSRLFSQSVEIGLNWVLGTMKDTLLLVSAVEGIVIFADYRFISRLVFIGMTVLWRIIFITWQRRNILLITVLSMLAMKFAYWLINVHQLIIKI